MLVYDNNEQQPLLPKSEAMFFRGYGGKNEVRGLRQDVVTLRSFVHVYIYIDLNLLKLKNSQHLDFPAKQTRQKRLVFSRKSVMHMNQDDKNEAKRRRQDVVTQK